MILATVLSVQLAPAYFVATSSDGSVAAIASNITVSGLHASTNSARSGNGLAGYSLNSQLNNAAQAKANHMLSNDYWAHVAPDGTTPWFFIGQSGYAYLSAGENLAYGFDTSAATVNGWINSPAHYTNLMSSNFSDVGYGIVSGSFQDGQYTIVVAMYGKPVNQPAPEPEPDPTPTTPAATPTPTPTPEPVAQTPSTPTPDPVVEEPDEVVVEPDPEDEQPDVVDDPEPTVPETQDQTQQQDTESTGNVTPSDQGEFAYSITVQRVTNLDALVERRADAGLIFSVATLSLGLSYFLYRHVAAVRSHIIAGERVLQDHPFLETIALVITLYLVLSATFGFVL